MRHQKRVANDDGKRLGSWQAEDQPDALAATLTRRFRLAFCVEVIWVAAACPASVFYRPD